MAISVGGNTAYTFYTSHYMNWWHDDSLVTPRPKIDIAADVITTIIDTNTSVDFGLLEFNYSEGGTRHPANYPEHDSN